MRAKTLLIILLLITPVIVASETTTLHSSWEPYNATISLDDYTFLLEQGSEESDFEIVRVRMQNESGSTAVQLDDCNELNNYTFCYDDKSFDNEHEVDIDRSGVLRPGMYIEVEQTVEQRREAAEPTYFIDINMSERDPSEENTGRIAVINQDIPGLFNFSGRLNVPEGIHLEPRDDDVLTAGQDILISRSIGSEETVSIPFTYEFREPKTQLVNFTYSYESRGETFEGVSTKTVEPLYPYNVQVSTDEEAPLYEEHDIELKIQTEADSPQIWLEDTVISIDRNQELLPHDEFNFGPGRSWHKSRIDTETNSSETYTFTIRPRYTGDTNITYNSTIHVGDAFTVPFNGTRIVNSAEPQLNITSVFPDNVTAGDEYNYTINISNPEPYTVYDVDLRGESVLGQLRFRENNVTPGEEIQINGSHKTSNVEPQRVEMLLETSYRTPTRDLIRHEPIREQTDLLQVPYDVSFNFTPSNRTPSIGQNISITVDITNIGRNNLDNLSFTLPNGTTLNKSLESDEETRLTTINTTYTGEDEFLDFNVYNAELGSRDERFVVSDNMGERAEELLDLTEDVVEAINERGQNESDGGEPDEDLSEEELEELREQYGDNEEEPSEPFFVELLRTIDEFFENLFGA